MMEEKNARQALATAIVEDDGALRDLFDQVTASDSMPLKMRCVIEGIGRSCGADRCYVYYRREGSADLWDNEYEWCAEGVESIKARQQGADMSIFPDAQAAVEANRIWSCSDLNRAHPSTRDWLAPQGIKAIIFAPFVGSDGTVKGCIGFDFVNSHPNPIPASTVRNLVDASNIITFCLRARHEQELSRRAAQLVDESGVGLWSMELDPDRPPRMYGNRAMDDLLGCDGRDLTPEEYYRAWYDHIHPEHYGEVNQTMRNLLDGYPAEAQYPFMHPVSGEMWVRCGGRRDDTYTKGVRVVGRHQDITGLLHSQKNNAAEISAVQRLAEAERDRADKERYINVALEMLVKERSFTRFLGKIMALWCRALGAQWCVLGEFIGAEYRAVYSYSIFGDGQIFPIGERLAYLPELSGSRDGGDERDYIALVDFQNSPVAAKVARMSSSPQVIRNTATCYSHVIRFRGERWGVVTLLFQSRHVFTDAEHRFIAAASHGIELALLRREYESMTQESFVPEKGR